VHTCRTRQLQYVNLNVDACVILILRDVVGAPLSGILSDRVLVAARKRRGNVWVPEDRLHPALIGAGAAVFVPCSVLFVGLILQFVHGRVGLVLICLCFFMNGLGVGVLSRAEVIFGTDIISFLQVDFVLSPLSAYNVDILHDRSAEVVAASM
jgi:hypothetical protein